MEKIAVSRTHYYIYSALSLHFVFSGIIRLRQTVDEKFCGE